ncbi:hypothetical protein AgCh_021864 [Apium graveolens]
MRRLNMRNGKTYSHKNFYIFERRKTFPVQGESDSHSCCRDWEWQEYVGQKGYALVPMFSRGEMLGTNQPVILHLLDIEPAAEALNAVKIELIDSAFPFLKGVVATKNVVEACTDVDIAIMAGGFPRKDGMERRKNLMSKNISIYKT